MDAVKELKWFVVILIVLGILWIGSGGLKSATKNHPFIKPAAPLSTGETYGEQGGIMEFLFPWMSNQGNSSGFFSGNDGIPVSPNGQLGGQSGDNDGKTQYGADIAAPGSQNKDAVKITRVSASRNKDRKAGSEYLTISAPKTNAKQVLLTGIILKSRMTGTQTDIKDGVPVYYGNTVNQKEPIFLKPGETAQVISGKSPIGYSFKMNKCLGYLGKSPLNFIISLPISGCPHILDYPLPERPNAFSDNCLDYLESIGSCQINFTFSKTSPIEDACKNFITERASYNRCVADFGNDPNFLGTEWRIYLGRDESLWKTRREIIDLIDQNGNLVSSYTY